MGKYSIWKKIHQNLTPNDEEKKEGLRLLKEYEERGYLFRLNRELLEIPIEIISDFFYRLSLLHPHHSPVSRKRNSQWLAKCDITSFNLKAASTSQSKASFIQGAMLLPGLRTQAIQLAPVSESETSHPDAILSHSQIDPSLLHPALNLLGLSPDEQLQCFIEAAHLCGITMGFDLSYQLSDRGEALFRKPELFRWIALDPEKRYIPKNHLSYQEMLSESYQKEICLEIRRLVTPLIQQGMERLDIHQQIRNYGFYPVPLSGEKQDSIPLFILYDHQKEEAQFTSSSEQKGITPFKFYQSYNDSWDYENQSIDYFARIFPLWQKKGFQFLFLDNVIGALSNSEDDVSKKEGPDKRILKDVILQAKNKSARSAVMASGKIEHLKDLLELGFDGLVDDQDPQRLDKSYIRQTFSLQQELKEINQGRSQPSSIFSRISLAEHNSPSFNQKVHLEHFCCRFMNCGNAGRRKFEMMGINDGSAGFSQSLKDNHGMQWREDKGALKQYHTIEDIYQRHRETLNKGEIFQVKIEENYAWWIIRAKKECLVAVISVENDPMLPPPYIEIDLRNISSYKANPTILEYDFQSTSGNLILTMTGAIEAFQIPYRGYRLYSLK